MLINPLSCCYILTIFYCQIRIHLCVFLRQQCFKVLAEPIKYSKPISLKTFTNVHQSKEGFKVLFHDLFKNFVLSLYKLIKLKFVFLDDENG